MIDGGKEEGDISLPGLSVRISVYSVLRSSTDITSYLVKAMTQHEQLYRRRYSDEGAPGLEL